MRNSCTQQRMTYLMPAFDVMQLCTPHHGEHCALSDCTTHSETQKHKDIQRSMSRGIATGAYHLECCPMLASYITAIVSARPPPSSSDCNRLAILVVRADKMAVLGILHSGCPSVTSATALTPRATPLQCEESASIVISLMFHQIPTERIQSSNWVICGFIADCSADMSHAKTGTGSPLPAE